MAQCDAAFSQPAVDSSPLLGSPPSFPSISEDSRIRDAVLAVLQSLYRSGSLETNQPFSTAPSMVPDDAPSVGGATGGGEGKKPHNVGSLYRSSGVGAIDNSTVTTTPVVHHDLYTVYPSSIRTTHAIGSDFAAPLAASLGHPPPLASSGGIQLRVPGMGPLDSASSSFSPNSLLFPLPSSLGSSSSSFPGPSPLSGLVSSSAPAPAPLSSYSSSSSLSSFLPPPLPSFAPSSLASASFPSSSSLTSVLPPSVSSVFPSSSSSSSFSFPSVPSSSFSFPPSVGVPSSSTLPRFVPPPPGFPPAFSLASHARLPSAPLSSSWPSSSSCLFLFFLRVVALFGSGGPPGAVVGSLTCISVVSSLVCWF